MQDIDGPAEIERADTNSSRAVANAATDSAAGVLYLASWLGTIAAGAVFGTIFGGIAGFIVGAILVAVVGAAVYATVIAIAQLLWLGRHLVATAGTAGALSGIAATLFLWDPSFLDASIASAAMMAALLGGIGGVLGAMMIVETSSDPQRNYDRKPIAEHSVHEVLLRFSIVAGLVAGWCWLSMAIYAARLPVSVAELQSRFEEHQAEFELVVTMAKEDKGVSIYSDGSFDDRAISRERGAAYLDLLSRAGLSGSRLYSKHEQDIRIEISPEGGFRDGIAKTYLYTDVEPQDVVVSFEERFIEGIGPGQSLHLSLGHNWYVSIERPEFGD